MNRKKNPSQGSALKKGAYLNGKKVTDRELMQYAIESMHQAIAPYSRFHVGAALETKDGKIYTGHNIESSSYSLTLCAERVALFKALSEGERHFKRIAIVASSGELCTPCGACRQVMADFAPGMMVFLADGKGKIKKMSLATLLPFQFNSDQLRR